MANSQKERKEKRGEATNRNRKVARKQGQKPSKRRRNNAKAAGHLCVLGR